MKTLRVTLADIIGPTGTPNSTATVHARYVDTSGRGRDVHLSDGTIVVPVRRSVTPGTGPERFDFEVIPSDDGDVREADRGFLTEVSWTVTAPEGGKAHGVRRVLVPSTADAVVQLGSLYEPTEIPAVTAQRIISGGTASAPLYDIRIRHDDSAGWAAEDPILSLGEEGIDVDTGTRKVGDGVTAWSSLPDRLGDEADTRAAADAALDGRVAGLEVAPPAHTHPLADVTDAGTAAAADVGDFATAAQGALADTAVQPADLTAYATDTPTALALADSSIPSATTSATYVANAIRTTALDVPTYEGSGKVLHPSVVFVAAGWNGFRYWMAATPFPGSDPAIENPSIWQSHDGITWTVPTGVTNPIEAKPSGGFNADTHLTLGPDGRLYCFWLATVGNTVTTWYRASSNGVDWSDKQTVRTDNALVFRPASPAIFFTGGKWHLWTVDIVPSPNTVVHATADTLTGTWTTPTVCTGLSAAAGARDIWHMDVKLVGGEYVLLFCDATLNSNGLVGSVYRAVSNDGNAWTQDSFPILTGVAGRWDQTLYRPSFLPANIRGVNGYRIWYSTNTADIRIGVADALPKTEWQDSPANLAAACGLYPGYLLGDVVNRADSTTTPGTATSGQAWTNNAGNVAGVASKHIYQAAYGNTRYYANVGTPDHEMAATYRALDAAAEQWLIVRFTDSSNYVRGGLAGNNWTIHHFLAGSLSGTAPAVSTALVPAVAGQRIRLRAKGTVLQLFVDDHLVIERATTVTTGNNVGFQFASTAARYRSLIATST